LGSSPIDLLGFAVAVAIGRIDEIDAGIDRLVDDAGGVLVIGVAQLAEHHGAKRVGTDLDAGATQRTVLHCMLLRRNSVLPVAADAVR
jgi:hypothetical protein